MRPYRKWEVTRLCRESSKRVTYGRSRDGGLSGLETLGWLTGDAARRAPHARSALINFFRLFRGLGIGVAGKSIVGRLARSGGKGYGLV